VLAAACARPGAGPIPEAAPDIIGTIADRREVRGGVSVRIEQDSTRSAGYPVAQVTVGSGARVLRRIADDLSMATAGELRVGTRVQAWFTGPVLRSYPAQATARLVVIVPEPAP
jgi:alkanesulfonate monooxygenase SsuD/methylene tetrahydromethanopterin reductase-like flavin-dependent oxidoreductase (luciferase family)